MITINCASTPGRELYHEVWRVVGLRFYDVERLKDWASWEHRFDEQIDNDESALPFIKEMMDSLNDTYSHVLEPEDVVVAQQRAECKDSAVLVKRLPGDIGYIRILSFAQENIFEQLIEATSQIADCLGYIVDLRNNRGGLVNGTANCCELFVNSGPITTVIRRLPNGKTKHRTVGLSEGVFLLIDNCEGEKEELDAYTRRNPITKGKPVAVLVNGETMSSAELMAAAIVDNEKASGLAVAIGTKTFGKAIAQSEYDILGRLTIKLSNARYLSPTDVWFGDAQQTVCNGLEPQIVVSDDTSETKMAPLDAALKWLKEKIGTIAKAG